MTREEIERVKALSPIERIVGQTVRLRRVGRTLMGCCPFHPDRNPSFAVYPDTGTYHCFACGEQGDVFTFVMKTEHCSFIEAVRRLCPWMLEERKAEGAGRAGRMSGAAVPVREDGTQAPAAEPCTASDPLTDPLLAPFYREAGVYIAPEGGVDGWRAMAGRMVFPLRNEAGEQVGVAGRRMKEDGSPKYINSANSDRFCKHRYLYGMEQAAAAARERHRLFLVEGYKDVLAMRAAGLPETAALCGVALGEGHLPLITGCTRRVVLLLDGDEAGRKGDAAARRLLEARGVEALIVSLPEGGDPDSLVREVGPRVFRERLEKALERMMHGIEGRLRQRVRRCMVQLRRETDPGRRIRWMRLLQECSRQRMSYAFASCRPGAMEASVFTGRKGCW